MEGGTIIWIILGVIALFLIFIYNKLIALRQTRNNAFSDIDVQLKQRYNLVPRLVDTVKGYAAHEKQILTDVTEARTQVGNTSGAGEDRVKAEGLLGGALAGLLAVAENYPDLKADDNFRQLMAQLGDIEDKIAAARRFFNSATSEYNTAVQQFPNNLIAGPLGFRTEPFFELEDALEDKIRDVPDVSFN